MPLNKSLYPTNWKDISYRIRVIRAKNRCENCGVPNYAIIKRTGGTSYRLATSIEERTAGITDKKPWSIIHQRLKQMKLVRIVLTVAHLDHNTYNNADKNLKALCQRCHLIWDARKHWATRKRESPVNRSGRYR